MAKINKKAKYNRFSLFDCFLYLIMILLMALIIVPFIHIISVSLSDAKYTMQGAVTLYPRGFTLATYKEILSEDNFLRAYGNTIFFTVVGTALSLTTTAMAAYALSRRRVVGHKLFSTMIMITMFFSGGTIPGYLAVQSYGLLNTLWAMILPSMISTWNLIIMRSFFVAYPSEIIESGQIDGLQDAGVFFRLVLPTSKAALATIGLYYAVAYWNAYMPARLYISDEAKYPVQHLLQRMIQAASGLENAMGGGNNEPGTIVSSAVRYGSIMVVIIPIMCVYPFIQKYFVKGVMVGSVKG